MFGTLLGTIFGPFLGTVLNRAPGVRPPGARHEGRRLRYARHHRLCRHRVRGHHRLVHALPLLLHDAQAAMVRLWQSGGQFTILLIFVGNWSEMGSIKVIIEAESKVSIFKRISKIICCCELLSTFSNANSNSIKI